VVGPQRNWQDPTDISDIPLLSDPLFVVMTTEHPMAHYKTISLKQLRNASWILPNPHITTSRELAAIFAVADVPWPVDAVTCDSIEALKALIVRTGRVTIMSRQLVHAERATGRLSYIPLRSAKPPRNLGIRYRGNAAPSPLARRFMRLLQDAAAEIGRARLGSG
jgi:DNA-binding transcriptional LysR family regulator